MVTHPWVSQSITAQSRVCKPPGPAQGYPVSQWRCFPRRGLSTHCPAAWRQLLRITNAANNRQEATGPQPCVPRPKHAAGTRRRSRIPEPPQYSLPGLWTREGESHQGREFRRLRLSPSPIQAGLEENKIFPWTLSRSFIFKQDPVEEEEDLPGVYRHHCRPQPHQFSQGSELGVSILLGLGRSGAVPSLGQAGTAQGTRAGTGTVPLTHRKGMRTGKINTCTYPSTWISSWGKEKAPRGYMCTQKRLTLTHPSLSLNLSFLDYF